MLLAIDIGNSNTSCGIFKGAKLIKRFDIPSAPGFRGRVIKKLGKHPKISACLICSVVPEQTLTVRRAIYSLTSKVPHVIGKDPEVPIVNLYRKPEQVGQDRLVNAYAASVFYGKPLVIIDSGTAITLDAVSGKGQYLGGMIAPGMEVSLKSLKENTALLPLVKPSRPKGSIGSDTKNSILSGVILGTADLCRGLTGRLKQRLGKNVRVIGTGGNIGLVCEYSGLNMKIDKDLTLKGINLIYRNETKSA